jgi:hypothetical protein
MARSGTRVREEDTVFVAKDDDEPMFRANLARP